MLLLLPASLPVTLRPRLVLLVGAAFFLCATLTLAWSPSPLDGVWQIVLLGIFACGCCIAVETDDLRPLWIGCAFGLAVSGGFAIAQAYGYHPVPDPVGGPPAGLFISPDDFAATAALCGAALAYESLWWAMPLVAPGLILTHSRAALAAYCVSLVPMLWQISRISVVVVISVGVAGVLWITSERYGSIPAIYLRLEIWTAILKNFAFFGHGLGSTWTLFQPFEHAHNEFFQVLSETGVPGLVLFSAFWLMLAGPMNAARAVLLAFAVEACFADPLHVASTLLLVAMAAGGAMRDRSVLRSGTYGRGIAHATRVARWPKY